MIDLDELIASTAPDVVPTADVVARHRAMITDLSDRDPVSSPGRVVELDPSPRRSRRRLRPMLLVAALVVAVIGGVVLLTSGKPAPETPATSTTLSPTTTIPLATRAPRLDTWEPTKYPWLPSDTPMGKGSTAEIADALVEGGGQLMVIGRLVEDPHVADSLTDVVTITVTDGPQDDRGWPGYTPLDPITIDGVEVDRWELAMNGVADPFQRAQWRPDLLVTAGDVAAVIDEIGPTAFDVLPNGYPEVDPLPEGFILLNAPGERPEATAVAAVSISVTETSDFTPGEGVSAVPDWSFGPELIQQGATRIDVNGTSGWLARVGNFYWVEWPIDEHTWFVVSASPTADRALEIARSVQAVDRAAWFERYPDAESTALGS